MASGMFEEKVHYLGAWQNNRVDNGVIAQINSQIQSEKGSKVKLQLSVDGLRVVKNTMIQGKTLQDYIPLPKIQLMTVSQRMPDLLIVISGARDTNYRFQVQVFRCGNAKIAATYQGRYQILQRSVQTVKTVVKTPANNENSEINWTLRSKEHDNSKRELKKFVDLHGEKAIVHKTDVKPVVVQNGQAVVQNGHTEVFETGVRIPLYRKGKPTRIESTQSAVSDEKMDGLDSRSEISESALRDELENLSQELRDIKFMLEQSTGVTTKSEPGSPRDFKPVNVEVHKHAVVPQPETVFVKRTEREEPTAVHAVVIDDDNDEVQMRSKSNGYYVTTSGNTTHVRVSVPDYRENGVTTKSEQSNGLAYTLTKSDAGYGTNNTGPEVSRSSTISYDSWKQDTLKRNTVVYRDIPERIQWKSRDSKRSHVVSSRPRSALPSFSSEMVQVRHHPAGYGPAYHQRASHHGQLVRMHDRRSQSLRTRGLSTTVARPIEKVYTGHPEARHHSLVMRGPASPRPSVLVQDGSVRGSQVLVVEENNNIVKPDSNDHNLLDVSGIDLYRETPTEVTVTEGAVIRT